MANYGEGEQDHQAEGQEVMAAYGEGAYWRANWCTVGFDNDGNARISRLDETGRVVAMVQVPREEVQGIGVSLLPSGVTVIYPEDTEIRR